MLLEERKNVGEVISMSITLRVVLIICSVLTFIFAITKIRQSKLKISDSIIWIIGSILLIIMSVFSGLVEWISIKLGFMSPVNFVFIITIFFLLVVSFNYGIKMSILNEKIKDLNHHIALKEYEKKNKEEL